MHKIRLIDFPKINDPRGNLSFSNLMIKSRLPLNELIGFMMFWIY